MEPPESFMGVSKLAGSCASMFADEVMAKYKGGIEQKVLEMKNTRELKKIVVLQLICTNCLNVDWFLH